MKAFKEFIKAFWGTTEKRANKSKLIFISMQLSEMRGAGKVEDLGQQWRQLKSEKKDEKNWRCLTSILICIFMLCVFVNCFTNSFVRLQLELRKKPLLFQIWYFYICFLDAFNICILNLITKWLAGLIELLGDMHQIKFNCIVLNRL